MVSLTKLGSRNPGLFACGIANQESEIFYLWNSESRAFDFGIQANESGSLYKNVSGL